MDSDKPLIFVSCGQRTEEERQLGHEICALIDDTTPFKSYFADYQSTLDGLTTNILGALDQAVGLITVMHHRGRVTYQESKIVRASVWIEQEIAIAAFIRQRLKRDIEVNLYVQHGIKIEGMRKSLIMNPTAFNENNEIIDSLKKELPRWCEKIKLPEISLEYKTRKQTSERHDYALILTVTNTGKEKMVDYHVDVEFPRKLAIKHTNDRTFVKARCTETHIFHRISPETIGQQIIYPGDPLTINVLDYYVDNDLYMSCRELFTLSASATLYSNGKKLRTIVIPLEELHNF